MTKDLQKGRAWRFALFVLLLGAVGIGKSYCSEITTDTNNRANTTVPEGAINGLFSVSATQQVYFSRGNLQYKASTAQWRFATNQYDYIGSANSHISSSYSGYIDLFGWGTSGWNCGNTYYRPWDYEGNNDAGGRLYGPSGRHDLTGDYVNSDWGYYNAISNGGNASHLWRTLTQSEWDYVFNTRSTTSGIRYAKAQVASVNGIILLPDNWSESYYSLININNGSANYSSNVINSSSWTNSLQAHGAVFLPAAGNRYGTSVGSVGDVGYYWSASNDGYYYGYAMVLLSDYFSTTGSSFIRCQGQSVRLVQSRQNTSMYNINATPNPAAGGTVTGSGDFNIGDICTVTATANPGYTFTNWTENGSVVSTNANYSFTVTGNRNLVANFTYVPQSFNVSVSANPSNGGSVSGGGAYQEGQSCTVHASPNSNYSFTNWTENGSVVSTNANYSFTVIGNRSLVANFTYVPQSFNVSVSANPSNGGSVSGGGAYQEGQSCTVHATPNSNYSFTNWTENGSVVSTNANYSFTVTGNRNLVANFTYVPQSFNVSVSANPTNGGSVSGGGTYQEGQSCTVHALAASGYTFINWTENGSFVSSNANYTFTVNRSRNLVANFTANPLPNYNITVTANPAIGGSVIGGGTYQQGQSCTVSAFANANYTFNHWTESGNVVSTNANYTFTVNGNRNLVAIFTYVPQNYSIAVSANPANGGSVAGGGSYQAGQSCTVRANANANYIFTEWRENGNVVSYNSNYTFTVHNNRNLVACFQTIEDIAEHESTTIAIYPNPVKYILCIEATEPIKIVEILNANGALVFKKSDCSDKTEINVQGLAVGTYIVRLTTASGVGISRFVKD